MVKKQNKASRRMKDTNAQKRRKKRLAHFGGKEQPMEFCHAAINAEWDRSKTLRQNYSAMGLATNPNKAMPIKKTDQQRKAEQADKEVTVTSGVLEELDKIQNMEKPEPYQVRVSRRRGREALHAREMAAVEWDAECSRVLSLCLQSMSIAEQKRLQQLITAHKDDYAAMFRDRSLNVMQETEAVLKKRIALYNKLQAL